MINDLRWMWFEDRSGCFFLILAMFGLLGTFVGLLAVILSL